MHAMALLASAPCLLSIWTTPAWAAHNAPASAGKFKGEFVRVYPDCRTPTLLTSNNFPACPQAPAEAACDFVPQVGRGQVNAKVTGTDAKLKLKMVGLRSAGCEGVVLQLVADIAVTADDCAGGTTCTTRVLRQQPLAECTVTGGTCTINTSIETAHPGTLSPGAHTTIALRRIGVQEKATGAIAFEAGIVAP